MYKIVCDAFTLHDDNLENLRVESPKLEIEINKSGSLNFNIYPSHPYYEKLNKMKSLIQVYQKDTLIFRGRILNDEEGFYKKKQVVCEGELAFLNDAIIRPYDWTGDNVKTVGDYFTWLITEYNSQVNEDRQFVVGNVTVRDKDTSNTNNTIPRSNTDYSVVLDELNSKLISSLGGVITFTFNSEGKRVINYITENEFPLSNQKVNFGENLVDIKTTTRGEDLVTVIIPFGSTVEGSETRLGLNGTDEPELIDGTNGIYKKNDYIYSVPGIEKYGRITKVKTYDDVTTVDYLQRIALADLIDLQHLVKGIEVTAIDLAGLKTDIHAFKIGTIVKVNSYKHDLIDANFIVSKISLDLLKPESNKLTLGYTFKTLTEKSTSEAKSMAGVISKAEQSIHNVTGIEQSFNEIKKQVASNTQKIDKAEIDYTENTQKVNEHEEKIGASEQAISELNQELSSMVNQTSEEIMTQVAERYYLKGETDTLISSLETRFVQTNDEFEFRFNEFNQNLSEVQNGTEAQFQDIRKYIRFVDGNILLGEEGNPLTLQIKNDRIAFLQNNVEVAYFSNRKLYVLDGEFLNTLKIGSFAFLPRTNGNVSWKKVT